MSVLPVNFGSTYGGFGETRGLLRQEGDGLVLEFKTKDSIFGVVESGVAVVPILDIWPPR